MKASTKLRYARKMLDRSGPNRGAANFYRAAVDDRHSIGGVPLDTVESAVTAAVRLGYKVAESQVDRAARLAKRMREAGDRATGGSNDQKRSDRRALDATEQLIFKTAMSGLGFLEGAAADPRNPLRRMATAQFQLLGSLLGLMPSDGGRTRQSTVEEPSQSEAEPQPQPRSRSTTPPLRGRKRAALTIRHGTAADDRRPVRVTDWELSFEAPEGTFKLIFFGGPSGRATFRGDVETAVGGALTSLTVLTSSKTLAGDYRAAICDADGVQLGYIALSV